MNIERGRYQLFINISKFKMVVWHPKIWIMEWYFDFHTRMLIIPFMTIFYDWTQE